LVSSGQLGVQHPLFGYQRSACPEGGTTCALNVGLIGLTWFPASVTDMLVRWHRVSRRQALGSSDATGDSPHEGAALCRHAPLFIGL
jgi:hypothetical protein